MLALLVAIVLLALVATALLTLWVVRRSRGDDDGGDPVEPTSPGPDGPIDWTHFDRERERWERSRTQ
jgi:hypothetical protein